MLGTEGITVSTVAKRFGLSEGSLFYFRKQQVTKQKKKRKEARPPSVRLRSAAFYGYVEAQRKRDDAHDALGLRAARQEKEASDMEDVEDYVLCLNTPIGWSDSAETSAAGSIAMSSSKSSPSQSR